MSVALTTLITSVEADITSWQAKITAAQVTIRTNQMEIAAWQAQLSKLVDMLNVLNAMTAAGMTAV